MIREAADYHFIRTELFLKKDMLSQMTLNGN